MSQFPTQNYAGQQQQQGGSNGMGIAALICGIIALLISWIPCVNFLAIILSLVALGLGIAGWVTSSGKGQSPAMSIIGIVLGVVAFIAFFVSYMALSAMGTGFADGMMTQVANMQATQAVASARQQGGAQADIDAAKSKFDTEMARVEDMELQAKIVAMQTALQQLESDLDAIEGVDVTIDSDFEAGDFESGDYDMSDMDTSGNTAEDAADGSGQ